MGVQQRVRRITRRHMSSVVTSPLRPPVVLAVASGVLNGLELVNRAQSAHEGKTSERISVCHTEGNLRLQDTFGVHRL